MTYYTTDSNATCIVIAMNGQFFLKIEHFDQNTYAMIASSSDICSINPVIEKFLQQTYEIYYDENSFRNGSKLFMYCNDVRMQAFGLPSKHTYVTHDSIEKFSNPNTTEVDESNWETLKVIYWKSTHVQGIKYIV